VLARRILTLGGNGAGKCGHRSLRGDQPKQVLNGINEGAPACGEAVVYAGFELALADPERSAAARFAFDWSR
jgi:hypothetical protein